MIEQHYIRIDEFKPNDFNYASMLVIEGKPFSYDIGSTNGKREDILDFITKRTLKREKGPNISFLFRYQTLEDTKIMIKRLQEDDFYSHYNIEMTPAVFASDENHNEIIKDILNKHALQRRMFDIHQYQY